MKRALLLLTAAACVACGSTEHQSSTPPPATTASNQNAVAETRAAPPPKTWTPEGAPVRRANPDVVDIGFGSRRVQAKLALSGADRRRGLGGRTSLLPDEGMLFVYRDLDLHSFWMKDCFMSIDILYLADDGKVIALQTMDPPAPGTGDDQLPRFDSPAGCRLVLEVGPGVSAACGVAVGTKVGLPPTMDGLYGSADP